MSRRKQEVQGFFDETHRYLSKNVAPRLRAEIVRGFLGDVARTRLLDVGCGDGSISLQFLGSGVSLTLLDVSAKMLDLARRGTPPEHLASVRFVQGDILHHTFDEQFDIALCLGVLAHVDNVGEMLRRLARSVAPGGVCVLQVTDQRRLVARLESGVYVVRRWLGLERRYPMNYLTLDVVLALARQCGLTPVSTRRYSLLLPGMGGLPLSFLHWYQRRTLLIPALSRHGSEVICLLKKVSSG